MQVPRKDECTAPLDSSSQARMRRVSQTRPSPSSHGRRSRVVQDVRDGRRPSSAEPLSASPCWSRPWRLDRTRRRGGASRPRSRKPSGAHLDCEPRDLVHGREWIPRRCIALVPRDARRHELAVTPPEHEEEWRERGGRKVRREAMRLPRSPWATVGPDPTRRARRSARRRARFRRRHAPACCRCKARSRAQTDPADSPPRERCR